MVLETGRAGRFWVHGRCTRCGENFRSGGPKDSHVTAPVLVFEFGRRRIGHRHVNFVAPSAVRAQAALVERCKHFPLGRAVTKRAMGANGTRYVARMGSFQTGWILVST